MVFCKLCAAAWSGAHKSSKIRKYNSKKDEYLLKKKQLRMINFTEKRKASPIKNVYLINTTSFFSLIFKTNGKW